MCDIIILFNQSFKFMVVCIDVVIVLKISFYLTPSNDLLRCMSCILLFHSVLSLEVNLISQEYDFNIILIIQ